MFVEIIVNNKGTIPSSIGSLTGVQLLYLCGNSLYGMLYIMVNAYSGYIRLLGTIPSTIGSKSALTNFQIFSNSFTGLPCHALFHCCTIENHIE